MGQSRVTGDWMSSALVTSSFIIWKLLSFSASRSKQQQVLPTSCGMYFLLCYSSSTDLRCLNYLVLTLDALVLQWQWTSSLIRVSGPSSVTSVSSPGLGIFETCGSSNLSLLEHFQWPEPTACYLQLFTVIVPITSSHYLLLSCSLQVLLLIAAAATVKTGTADTPTPTQHPSLLPV